MVGFEDIFIYIYYIYKKKLNIILKLINDTQY